MDHVGQGFEALGAMGRSVSAQRLKGIGPLVPPDSSRVVAWAASSVPAGVVGGWLASGS